jgi:hypothetical protein
MKLSFDANLHEEQKLAAHCILLGIRVEISSGRSPILTELLRGPPQLFQENAGIVPKKNDTTNSFTH